MTISIFQDSEREYMEWLANNKNGYVLTTVRAVSKEYMSLHRSTCRKISQYMSNMAEDAFTGKKYIKICSLNPNELSKWIRGKGGYGFTKLCLFCKPDPSQGEFDDNDAENEISRNPNLSETEKQQLIKARIGQGVFRDSLIKMWGGCCCVTGCNYVNVLRASHIKPWRESTNSERLDKLNGLLLSPNLDALFDKGLISFADDGKVLISQSLSDDVCKALGVSMHAKADLKSGHVKYMRWHREKIFLGPAA